MGPDCVRKNMESGPYGCCLDGSSSEPLNISADALLKSQRILLTSSDGYQFVVHQQVAQFSGLINNVMKFERLYPLTEGQKFQEVATRVFHFDQIPGFMLEKVCQYMYYKAKYCHSTGDFPEFDLINEENAADLFLVADYLDI